eukprot:SAG11_NODE_1791_length_4254_cov_29.079904_1_plen_90_part_00
MIGVSFYYRVVPPVGCTHETSDFFLSKFLYVRDFPEYPYNIAQIRANVITKTRSRKTYSRYMKKIRPSENLALFLVTQYVSALTYSPLL